MVDALKKTRDVFHEVRERYIVYWDQGEMDFVTDSDFHGRITPSDHD